MKSLPIVIELCIIVSLFNYSILQLKRGHHAKPNHQSYPD